MSNEAEMVMLEALSALAEELNLPIVGGTVLPNGMRVTFVPEVELVRVLRLNVDLRRQLEDAADVEKLAAEQVAALQAALEASDRAVSENAYDRDEWIRRCKQAEAALASRSDALRRISLFDTDGWSPANFAAHALLPPTDPVVEGAKAWLDGKGGTGVNKRSQ